MNLTELIEVNYLCKRREKDAEKGTYRKKRCPS